MLSDKEKNHLLKILKFFVLPFPILNKIFGVFLIKAIIVVTVNIILIRKNPKQIKKVLKKVKDFHTRLLFANQKVRRIYFLRWTQSKTMGDLIKKLQSLKGKTKLGCNRDISSYSDQMIHVRQRNSFKLDEDAFSEGAQSKAFIMHEVSFFMDFLYRRSLKKIFWFVLYCF